MCRIGIIDTGVQTKHLNFRNRITGYSIKLNKGKVHKGKEYNDIDGHGTAITWIVDRSVCDCEIVVIKIDQKSVATYGFETWLCEALEYIDGSERFDIINISCGVTICENMKHMKSICDRISSKGTQIVAAYDNDGVMTYPACFESVIGVDYSDEYHMMGQYDYIDDIVNIKTAQIKWKLPKEIKNCCNVSGNSFSAAYFTGLIANYIKSGALPESIKSILQNNAIKSFRLSKQCYNLNSEFIKFDCRKIKKAIVLPFNKEIQVLALNEDALQFKILGYYDRLELGNVGKSIGNTLHCNNEKVILDYKTIAWNDDFDTVIIGHCRVLSRIIGINVEDEIINLCLRFHKNLYMFDEFEDDERTRMEKLFVSHKLWFRCPQKGTELHKEWGGKLYDISHPVVCVAGTASMQGKFSVQINLRHIISDMGYKVASLGTEPSSELLGFEGMFTLGYEALMPYKGWENIIAINRSLHAVDKEDCDIILTGLQGRTIPYKTAAFEGYPIRQYEFIMGVSPDAYVLCINRLDNCDTIKRTINYLECVFGSKVLYLCVNDINMHISFFGRCGCIIKNALLFKKKTAFLSRKKTIRRIAQKCIAHFK